MHLLSSVSREKRQWSYLAFCVAMLALGSAKVGFAISDHGLTLSRDLLFGGGWIAFGLLSLAVGGARYPRRRA